MTFSTNCIKELRVFLTVNISLGDDYYGKLKHPITKFKATRVRVKFQGLS